MNSKVSLFYLYGLRNAGDAAIGLGALSFLKNNGYDVTGFSRWPDTFSEYKDDSKYYQRNFNDISIKGSPFYFRRSRNFLLRFVYYARSCLSLFFGKKAKEMRNEIIESDLVVLNGGNLMRCQSITDLIRLVAFLYPLMVAKTHKIPYVIFPQSTVKLNKLGRFIVYPIFKSARTVWVREKSSLKIFEGYFPRVKFNYAPDLAFHINNDKLYDKPITKTIDDNNGIVNISMTFRSFGLGDIAELSDEKREQIRNTIINVLNQITTTYKVNLTLVVQCDKDLNITNEIMERIQISEEIKVNSCNLFDSRDTYELISFYETQDLLLGMRLHSIILALSRGIPCAGFFEENWGLKNPGLLNVFGLPFCFIGEDNRSFASSILEILKNKQEWHGKIVSIVKDSNENFEKVFKEVIGVDEF